MNTPTAAHVIAEGFVEHPAGAMFDEPQLMCAECGAIGGHTKKCAIPRFAKAKRVGPARIEAGE